jgi:hypothetical protein
LEYYSFQGSIGKIPSSFGLTEKEDAKPRFQTSSSARISHLRFEISEERRKGDEQCLDEGTERPLTPLLSRFRCGVDKERHVVVRGRNDWD